MRLQSNLKLAFFACLIFLSAPGYANTLDALNIFFKSETFRADFEQVVYSAEGQKIDESKGYTLFHRPGRFRWEYISPEPYLILTDGLNLLIYDIPLKQAYMRPTLSTLGKAPLMLLLDKRAAVDDFHIDTIAADAHSDISGVDWLRLIPKTDDTDFVYFDIGFKEGTLSNLILYDHFDQYTKIYFDDVQINPQFSKDHFRIQLPEDVDIIQN